MTWGNWREVWREGNSKQYNTLFFLYFQSTQLFMAWKAPQQLSQQSLTESGCPSSSPPLFSLPRHWFSNSQFIVIAENCFAKVFVSLRQIKCQTFSTSPCYSAACCMPRFNCMFDAVKLNLFNGLRHLSLATSNSNSNYNRSSQSSLINVVCPTWRMRTAGERDKIPRKLFDLISFFVLTFYWWITRPTHKSQATQSHSHFTQLAR